MYYHQCQVRKESDLKFQLFFSEHCVVWPLVKMWRLLTISFPFVGSLSRWRMVDLSDWWVEIASLRSLLMSFLLDILLTYRHVPEQINCQNLCFNEIGQTFWWSFKGIRVAACVFLFSLVIAPVLHLQTVLLREAYASTYQFILCLTLETAFN